MNGSDDAISLERQKSTDGSNLRSFDGRRVNPASGDASNNYYRHIKRWMIPFFKDGPNSVLDLGCAAGLLGACLLESGKAAVVDGVEIFAPVAQEAAKRYRRVHVGDVEGMALDYRAEFDYVVCGDILEHLKDPYAMMHRIHDWLKPGGSLLVCLPNVRSYRVLKEVIFCGEWKYVSSGILDRTHLRFFTRRSCQRMFEEAEFRVTHEQIIIDGPRKQLLNRITFGWLDEFLASQIFVCGIKEPAK
jgi:2-polyprenyl-3-methyl-5-hydroxy-6-metoxy-1,4-benzoquinol methylase